MVHVLINILVNIHMILWNLIDFEGILRMARLSVNYVYGS